MTLNYDVERSLIPQPRRHYKHSLSINDVTFRWNDCHCAVQPTEAELSKLRSELVTDGFISACFECKKDIPVTVTLSHFDNGDGQKARWWSVTREVGAHVSFNIWSFKGFDVGNLADSLLRGRCHPECGKKYLAMFPGGTL